MKTSTLARHGLGPRRLAGLLVALCVATACVTQDATTGEVQPRGNQKYPFEKVEKSAEELQVGMSKTEVLLLLGSPAELQAEGSVWLYLPERRGVLVPARALRLEFRGQQLAEHAFQSIVLGARL